MLLIFQQLRVFSVRHDRSERCWPLRFFILLFTLPVVRLNPLSWLWSTQTALQYTTFSSVDDLPSASVNFLGTCSSLLDAPSADEQPYVKDVDGEQ